MNAEFPTQALTGYLRSLGYPDAEVVALRALARLDSPGQKIKGFGYGEAVLIEFTSRGRTHRAVLRTMRPDPFGHDFLWDRAQAQLLAYHTFNKLQRHVRVLDIGTTRRDQIVSLAETGEFFLLTTFAPGQLYADDLVRLRDTDRLTDLDRRRAQILASYLAEIHSLKHAAPELYVRRIRDTVGLGEGIFGMLDTYPADCPEAPAELLKEIEAALVEWRWRLKSFPHRLSQVHGDFHPFNIVFSSETEFSLLDRSRGEWGEPADDLAALTINYLFFALQRDATRFAPALRELWTLLWQTYLQATADSEILRTAPLFFTWRALVVAHPVWYPNLAPEVRTLLLRFARDVLSRQVFDWQKVETYLW